MKRLLAICLLTTLLFTVTGCSLVQSYLSPRTEASPVPTEAPQATPGPTPVNSSMTDSGIKIRVDYSQYQPKEQVEGKYTRLQEEWIQDLKPVAGRKGIYPYIGGPLYINGGDGFTWIQGYTYGFVDDQGCIIADPTYIDVFIPGYWDPETETVKNLPFYVMGRAGSVSEDGYFGSETYAVATMDGRFVTECKYRLVTAGDYGLCLREDYGSTEFLLIDQEGNTILTDKDLEFLSDFHGEYFDMDYGEGLFVVRMGNESAYFMDLKGNLVLGPYEAATPFACGRACIRQGEYWGVIDRDGNWIIKPDKYTDAMEYRGNYMNASYRDAEGNFHGVILDRNGKRIQDEKGAVFMSDDNGLHYAYKYGDGASSEDIYVYDENWKLLQVYQGYNMYGNLGILTKGDAEKEGWELISIATGATLKLKPHQFFYGTGPSSEGYYENNHFLVVYNQGEENHQYLYDPETLELLEEKYGTYREIKDESTGELYLVYDSSAKISTLMTLEREVIGTYRGEIRIYNGQIMILNEQCVRYRTLSGEEWFCLPLTNNYDD